MGKILALINKETLRLIREKTQVSYDYLSRSTGKEISILKEWEDVGNISSLPTIPQAKALAYSLRVPFAGLYMPPSLNQFLHCQAYIINVLSREEQSLTIVD